MNPRKLGLSLTPALSLVLLAPVASLAQTATPSGSTAPSVVDGQTSTPQRMADRASLRAKKNAELSKLEKSGYTPGGDAIHYPQSFQDAQRKISQQN